MMQCRRCGREATHIEYDGYDSDLTCAEYPECVGDTARDSLGKMVRAIWIQWAHQQPVCKPHWVTPYEELDEPDKEVDRRIGERVFEAGRKAALEGLSDGALPEPAKSRLAEVALEFAKQPRHDLQEVVNDLWSLLQGTYSAALKQRFGEALIPDVDDNGKLRGTEMKEMKESLPRHERLPDGE